MYDFGAIDPRNLLFFQFSLWSNLSFLSNGILLHRPVLNLSEEIKKTDVAKKGFWFSAEAYVFFFKIFDFDRVYGILRKLCVIMRLNKIWTNALQLSTIGRVQDCNKRRFYIYR